MMSEHFNPCSAAPGCTRITETHPTAKWKVVPAQNSGWKKRKPI